jgi:uncharacterized cupin superfamily protein
MDHIAIERKHSIERLGRTEAGDWRIWIKEPGEFTRYYGEDETCYLLEGAAVIIRDAGHMLKIEKGDLISISAGTSCRWKIQESIQALYQSGPLYNLFI